MQQSVSPADLSGNTPSIYFESAKLLYNKHYDTLDGYSFDSQFQFNEAEFDTNWETQLISEEGRKEMKRREERETERRRLQQVQSSMKESNKTKEIYREVIQYEDDRLNSLLNLLTKIEENTRFPSQSAYTTSYVDTSYPSSLSPKYSMKRDTGKVETDHHRMMNQVKQVAAINRRLNK